jgi:type IV pilus assembly protein PilY1
VAAFGYLRDDSNSRYGGVLRAPMKYVGPHAYDSDFNLISGTNAAQEWNESTGVFYENPDASTEFAVSGVTNYLNRFGRTGAVGVYKTYDPVNELYYESLRYLQGLAPTPAAISGLTSGDAKKDGFPVYTTWTDPHPAITGLGTTGDYSCVKNNLLTIGDVNTHYDKQIPGSTASDSYDAARPANPSGNEPDFKAWTNVVGGFESAGSIGYTDGKGNAQTTSNPNAGNTARAGLENQNPSDHSNYFMSGMAYWANTHDIRGTGWSDTAKRRPGMRMRTYIVDVNEYGAQTNVTTRHNNQFYLAAKYGGFRDESDKGNPFYKADGTVDNTIWQQGNGDAKTYFLAGDPLALLSSLDTIFEQIASEASSIAGGAITTQTLTASGGNIYQASFDPSDWSGDVISYTLGLNANGTVALGTSQTAAWRAGAVLDARTAARNIIVGSKTTTVSTAAGTDFLWNNLSTAQQTALQLPSAAASAPDPAASGAERLNYIRGDRTLESPAGPYRKRASLLGDIVNSGVVFKGAPTLGINDSGYASFYASHVSRTPALYVGANDGMLHAFNGTTGEELFAYIPNFLVPYLNLLTSTTYSHQRSYVDATPVVAEANLGSSGSPSWKTVLVSGVGAGAQGVFALDVTDPSSFTAASVLWEFTDADDSALGNVIGRPQVMKIRTSAASATTPTYKWFAVFASGVNNYVDDGQFSTTGKPALFFLDLSKPVNAAWTEGSNYFKVTFPQDSTTVATGMVGFSATGGSGGELAQLYAGDLQGNLWKLDFTTSPAANATAVDVSSLLGGTAAVLDASNPLFIAVSGANLQPISMEPALLVGPNRSTIVSFGTGKFLESSDTNGSYSTQSVYAILDANAVTIPSRGRLSAVNQNASTGALTASAFAWGIPSSDADMSARAGWYLDFVNSATSGERQISGMGVFGNQLIFGSVIPAQGGCDEGSGKLYAITQTSGVGSSATSTVGILGAPFILQTGNTSLTTSDSTGLRKETTHGQVILQGSSGLTTFNTPMSYTDVVGRLSWRQINNYQEIKAAP